MIRAVVVAGGHVAFYLCRSLRRRGYEVVLVSSDAATAAKVAALDVTVCLGDGTVADVLEDAGAGSADELIALGERDADTLTICQLARLRFRVPRVLAVVQDPESVEVFRALGIESAFSAVRVLVRVIEERASFSGVQRLEPMADGRIELSEVLLPDDSPALGISLTELPLPRGALIAYVLRAGEVIVPHGGTCLAAGDRVLLVTPSSQQRAALATLLRRRLTLGGGS
jgi:trk system potassium uptake protein